MSSDAALESGYAQTLAEANAIGKLVAAVDRRPGTQRADAYDANTHAMSGLTGRKDDQNFQECKQAYEGTQQQIMNDVERGDVYGAAHTIQDSYSPSHFGYKQWDGGHLGNLHVPGVSHMTGEDFRNSYSPDVQAATEATADFFDAYVKNKQGRGPIPDPKAFLAPQPCGP